MRRTEGTRVVGGGISSKTVTTHAGSPTAKGSIVVVDVAQFMIHWFVDIKEGFVVVPGGVASVTVVQTGILSFVERTASMLGSEKRAPQKSIVYVVISDAHGKDTTVSSGVLFSEGRPMGWYEG